MPTVPEFDDTTDLRTGPEIHDALLGVLPLVGRWAGFGTGIKPESGDEFSYAQRISFTHDGRPFLAYQSHTWLLGPDGTVLRPAFRESGFLRPGATEDQLEFTLTDALGLVEVFDGMAGDLRWELITTAIGFTPTATQVAGERRLYALSGSTLAYVQELAREPGEFRPHLNAQLDRG